MLTRIGLRKALSALSNPPSYLKSVSFFSRFKSATAIVPVTHKISEWRTEENEAITKMTKKTQVCREILSQLTENKLVPVTLQGKVKELLETHDPTFNVFQLLIDTQTPVIKDVEGKLDMLNKKLKRAQEKSEKVEKDINELTARLETADGDLKQLKHDLGQTHDGSYIPLPDFRKLNELLITHTLSFIESCDLIAAACEESKEHVYPFLTPEQENAMKEYLHEHGSKSYENMRLKIHQKENFIKDSASTMELLIREHDLVERKKRFLIDQIKVLETQLNKQTRQVIQLNELVRGSLPDPSQLVESDNPSVTRLSKI